MKRWDNTFLSFVNIIIIIVTHNIFFSGGQVPVLVCLFVCMFNAIFIIINNLVIIIVNLPPFLVTNYSLLLAGIEYVLNLFCMQKLVRVNSESKMGIQSQY